MSEPRQPSNLLAMAMSVVPGLAQVYLDHTLLGAALFSAWFTSWNGLFLAANLQSANTDLIHKISVVCLAVVWVGSMWHAYALSYGTDRSSLANDRRSLLRDALLSYLRNELDLAVVKLDQAIELDVDWQDPDPLFHLGVVLLRQAEQLLGLSDLEAARAARRRSQWAFRTCIDRDSFGKWRSEIQRETRRMRRLLDLTGRLRKINPSDRLDLPGDSTSSVPYFPELRESGAMPRVDAKPADAPALEGMPHTRLTPRPFSRNKLEKRLAQADLAEAETVALEHRPPVAEEDTVDLPPSEKAWPTTRRSARFDAKKVAAAARPSPRGEPADALEADTLEALPPEADLSATQPAERALPGDPPPARAAAPEGEIPHTQAFVRPENLGEIPLTSNATVPDDLRVFPATRTASVPDELRDFPATRNTTVPDELRGDPATRSTGGPDEPREFPVTRNTTVPDELRGDPATRSTGVPDEPREFPVTRNTTVPDELRGDPATRSTGVPDEPREFPVTRNTTIPDELRGDPATRDAAVRDELRADPEETRRDARDAVLPGDAPASEGESAPAQRAAPPERGMPDTRPEGRNKLQLDPALLPRTRQATRPEPEPTEPEGAMPPTRLDVDPRTLLDPELLAKGRSVPPTNPALGEELAAGEADATEGNAGAPERKIPPTRLLSASSAEAAEANEDADPHDTADEDDEGESPLEIEPARTEEIT